MSSKRDAGLTRQEHKKTVQNPVTMAERPHLFPSRTQQLSSHASKVLGWKRPGRIDCCRSHKSPRTYVRGLLLYDYIMAVLLCLFNHYDALHKIHYNLSTYIEAGKAYPIRKDSGSCINRSVRILRFSAFWRTIHYS